MRVRRFLESGFAVRFVESLLVAEARGVISRLGTGRLVQRWQPVSALLGHHLEALLGCSETAE